MFGREVFKHLSAWKADFVTSLERRKIPNELSGNYLFCMEKESIPSGINLSFERLSPSKGQVGYVLLTRAPVASKESKLSS